MRKLLFSTIAIIAMLTSCSQYSLEDVLITGYEEGDLAQSFSSAGSESIFEFKAEDKWTASIHATKTKSTPDWVQIDKTKGEPGDASIKITIAENTEGVDRKSTVVIFCGLSAIEIDIVQKAVGGGGGDDGNEVVDGDLTYDSASLAQDFNKSGGQSTFTFTAKDKWTASIVGAPAWVTINKTEGEAGEASIEITQDKDGETLIYNEDDLDQQFATTGGESTFNFTAKGKWVLDITQEQNLVTFDKSSGTAGDISIKITASPNDYYQDRIYRFRLSSGAQFTSLYVTIEKSISDLEFIETYDGLYTKDLKKYKAHTPKGLEFFYKVMEEHEDKTTKKARCVISFTNETTFGTVKEEAKGRIIEVILPNVTEINENTFKGCSALNTVELNKCIIINKDAFSGCFNLSNLSIPVCTEIATGAFREIGARELRIRSCKTIEFKSFEDAKFTTVQFDVANFIENDAFTGSEKVKHFKFLTKEEMQSGFASFSGVHMAAMTLSLHPDGVEYAKLLEEYPNPGDLPADLGSDKRFRWSGVSWDALKLEKPAN